MSVRDSVTCSRCGWTPGRWPSPEGPVVELMQHWRWAHGAVPRAKVVGGAS